jgi:hypothetical protein
MRKLMELRERNDEIARCVNKTFFCTAAEISCSVCPWITFWGDLTFCVSEAQLGCQDAFLPEKKPDKYVGLFYPVEKIKVL